MQQMLSLIQIVDPHEQVNQRIISDSVHSQVRPWLDIINKLQPSVWVIVECTPFDECILSDQVRFDCSVCLHLFEVGICQVEVVSGNTRVDHAVV